MAKIRRSGLALPPGNFVGEVLTWDGIQWGPQALPPPVGSTPQAGDILIFNTTTNSFTPASFLTPPANPRQFFEIASFVGVPDGTLVATWPDVSGNVLDITAAGAARPTLVTHADGIRALRFDGVANVLRRLAMAAVNTPHLTVFLVADTVFPTGGTRWDLSAAVVPGAVGSATGFGGVAGGSMGARANNLGGATLRGVGMQTLDGGSADASAGFYGRRAYCFKWGNSEGGGNARWGQWSMMGDTVAFTALSVVPVATNFNFTHIELGASGNGGGAPNAFSVLDYTFFSYYEGANSASISLRRAWMELKRLQTLYNCL